MVRRSARSNKGQHSKYGTRKKREVDVVDDDDGEIRCLCGDNEDDGGFMIQCETCAKWQHGVCMGYESPDEVSDSYACEVCRPDLYKDVSVKAEDKTANTTTPVKKKAAPKEKPVLWSLQERLTGKKSSKRKTPPSEESSDDGSDFSSDEDDIPEAPSNVKKKQKTASTTVSSPPKKSSPQERKKLPPINTTRRASQSTPQQQRRSSTSATPVTPVALVKTPLASKFDDVLDQKRVPAARIFAKIFEPIEPSRSEALGLAIEHALYSTFATAEPGHGAEYKNKFRSISFNLKDPKNSALRERVLTGDLRPEALVKLTSDEMANQELRAQAEKIREEGVAQSVLKVQTGPRIRRTHKGEEIVGDEITTITPMEGTAPAPFARAEDKSPSVKGNEEIVESPRSIGSHHSFSTPPPPPTSDEIKPERRQSTSTFNIQNVWSHLRSPTLQDEPGEPMIIDSLPDDIPQNQIDDPELDRIINDDIENSPPYSPSAYVYEPPPDAVAKYPPIWAGDLSMPSVAHFSAEARFVGGPHSVTDLPWSNILPTHIVIDGRIAIDTTSKYLDAQRSSSTKDVIVIQIEAAENSHKEMHLKLYQYFHDRQRYGVLSIQSNIVKDAYLVPLSPDEPIPTPIESMDSHDIPQTRTEPCLLVILVVQKNIPAEATRSPVAFSPPKTAPQMNSPTAQSNQETYSPPAVSFPIPEQPTTFTQPTSSIESLGLSPADLAALQGVLIAHPEILNNPQILTNPAILQSLIQQHLSGQQW